MDRIQRKEPQGMGEVMKQFIKDMDLASGLNVQRIFAAWDRVSGAAAYTAGKYYRNGTLYCTISSSVVRNSLSFSKEKILMDINAFLMDDELFIKDGPDGHLVRKLVLK